MITTIVFTTNDTAVITPNVEVTDPDNADIAQHLGLLSVDFLTTVEGGTTNAYYGCVSSDGNASTAARWFLTQHLGVSWDAARRIKGPVLITGPADQYGRPTSISATTMADAYTALQ